MATENPNRSTWREAAVALIDISGDIGGGLTLIGLPLLVMLPGLTVGLVLCIPLLLPFIVLPLVIGVLAAPFLAIWGLVRLFR